MSVPEQIPYVGYVGNGTATEFPIAFDLHDPDYLVVTRNKEIPAVGAYTVDMNALKVVFGAAPNSGDQIELYRETQLDRDTNYKSYDNSFRPEAVNWDFDKIIHILQEQHMIDAEIAARLKGEIEWRRTHDANFDELAMMRDAQIFSGLKQYLDTILAGVNPNIFGGITAGIVFALDKKSVQTHLEDIYVGLEEERLNLAQEIERATKIESVLDQKIDSESTRAQAVEGDLLSQINAVGVGNKAYKTYALMDADKVNIPAKSKVTVTNDATDSNNGDWQWDGVAFTKSAFDPVGQAKDYTNQKVKSISIKTSDSDLHVLTASGGEAVFAIDENAKANVVDLSVGGKDLDEILQDTKNDILKTDQNADLYVFPDKSKQKIVLSLKANGRLVGAKPFDLGIDALFAKATSNNEMTQIGLYHDIIKAQNKEAYNFTTQVYAKNDPSDGFTNEKTARMASIVKISESKIFISWVVFDKIANSDQSHGVMLGRFVDFDLKNKTATVDTNTVVVAGERGVTTEALRHAVFTRILNKETGKFRYLCLYNSGSFATSNIKVHIIYSDDDCKTWSQPREVMDQNTHPATALVPDSLHRIEKGEFAGRLVCGGFGVNADKTGYNVGIIFSDDNGETWRNGSTIENTAFNTNDVTYGFLNETSVCPDNSGDLLLAIRNESASSLAQRTVLFARSKDGGNTLYIDKDEPRIETSICQVGLLQAAKNLQDGIPKILLSFPSEPFAAADGYTRRSLRIGFSYDNGKSYPLIYSARKSDAVSGYTHMIALSDQDFVIVEEPTETIVVTFFNMSDVLKNGVIKNG